MHNYRFLGLAVLSTLALGACESAQEQLGLTRQAPDEFKVVKRAPLEIPPTYTLRPPSPGAPRPQEQETVEQARQSVFGEEVGSQQSLPSSSEGILLQQAGANQIDPGIRQKVDKESAELVDEDQPVFDKLMNLGSDAPAHADVVDAKKETERLQKNKQEGKPVTEGETPSVED